MKSNLPLMQRMGKLNEQWPWVASVPLADIKLRFV